VTRDPYRYFRVEAHELLEQLSRGALGLEKGDAGAGVPQLLRLAHTLKGAARVVKQREIADLAHALEDLLAPYRDSPREVTRDRVDEVLAALDRIGEQLARLPGPARDPEGKSPEGESTSIRAVRAEISEVDALLEGLGEVHGELGRLRSVLGGSGRARGLASRLAAQAGGPARALAEEVGTAVGAMERDAAVTLERVDRELRLSREMAERLRLVSAGATFSALQRVVRDTAHAAGKRVAFGASGAEVRLDGHVLDAVRPALVQLVRNAVAHGIEPEAERRRAGKPAEGQVRLHVARQGQRVVFRCSDDGRGVDLEAVRRALERRGGLPAGTERLEPAELLRRLLEGGLTTSDAVTQLAGRGIGLDVVRNAAERVGGDVSLHTDARIGTAVAVRVPVSLVSLEALIVEAAGSAAALPLDAVRGALRVAGRELTRSPQGDALTWEGGLVPVLPLGACLGGEGSALRAPPGARDETMQSAVLVHRTRGRVALVVDRILGVETVVLRPMPALAPVTPIISGLYLDAEGDPRPVLDADALADPATRSAARADGVVPRARPILVVDDSVTTRMLEQSILESAGYEVDLATSGEQGLEMAQRNRYGLFLVDVEMPGMDGFALVERLRADPVLRDVPCVLVTSRDAAQDRERGMALGASGYVVKSEFDQAEFLGRVAKLVRS